MRVKMIVAYNGTNYYGFQRQKNKPSIQGELEKILSQILVETIEISGAGRTDAGVHALGQVVSFVTTKNPNLDRLRYSLNRLLSKDIRILSIEEVCDSFHPRMFVKEKEYMYRIHIGEASPFLYPYRLEYPLSLNVLKMKEALLSILGTHEFSYFTSKKEDKMQFVRTIYQAFIEQKDDEIVIHFIGDGFMRYMIRLLVGALLEIGREREDISFIQNHLDNGMSLETCRYKAPAEGLYLMRVTYEEGEQ